MTQIQPGKERDAQTDLSTLKLERRADGQLWLVRDGDDDSWYEAALEKAKPADEKGAAGSGHESHGDGAAKDKGGVDAGGEDAACGNGATAGGTVPDGVAVRIAPCFPWSRARQYISLRTTCDKEVALIRSLDELAEGTRRLVEAALAEIGFVLEITRVTDVRTEIEIRNWQVETKQGPCTFQTKLDDWPHPLGDGTLVLRDVAGNLFLLPDPATLDARSRKLLWPFVG